MLLYTPQWILVKYLIWHTNYYISPCYDCYDFITYPPLDVFKKFYYDSEILYMMFEGYFADMWAEINIQNHNFHEI